MLFWGIMCCFGVGDCMAVLHEHGVPNSIILKERQGVTIFSFDGVASKGSDPLPSSLL